MKSIITAYEASQKYGFSLGYIRRLMRTGMVKGRQAQMNPKGTLWLIEESSLKKFCNKAQKRREALKKKS